MTDNTPRTTQTVVCWRALGAPDLHGNGKVFKLKIYIVAINPCLACHQTIDGRM